MSEDKQTWVELVQNELSSGSGDPWKILLELAAHLDSEDKAAPARPAEES